MTAQIIDLSDVKRQRWAQGLYQARAAEERRSEMRREAMQEYADTIACLDNPAPNPIAPKAPRARCMQLTDAQARVLKRLNQGEAITSTGWIDKPTQRMLDRLTKKGWLVEGRDYTFPKDKRCWIAAPMLEEVLPPCYKF